MSSFIFNVTFDCSDPRGLATFWSAVTGYRPVTERQDFVALRAPDKRGVRQILFFKVPEPKVAKSRVHVDLAARDPEQEIERLVALGATKLEHREGNGTSWTVMLDPEGNEFCVG
jgi:Glyoxalase-like domain